MRDSGHQHHHGVKKNIVEGIGGLIIGAAAVLLAVRFFKGSKAESQAGTPALPAPAKADEAQVAAKRAPARRVQTAKAAPVAAAKAPAKTTAAKRASRPRAKPAATAATPTETPES